MTSSSTKKVVLVTGAAGGIGRACVSHLLNTGYAVVGFDRDGVDSPFDQAVTADYLHCQGNIADAGHCQAAVEAATERYGRLDGLIHWAGIHSRVSWDELTADAMNEVLAVNVTGSLLIAQASARAMMQGNSGGALVLTGSTAVIHGTTGGQAGNGGPAYVASKAAMTGLVRSLARSMGAFGIRVNGVVPGVTETPMIANYSKENYQLQASQCAVGRIGQPADIAEVGCFLVSDSARYISGEMIIVNEGAAFG